MDTYYLVTVTIEYGDGKLDKKEPRTFDDKLSAIQYAESFTRPARSIDQDFFESDWKHNSFSSFVEDHESKQQMKHYAVIDTIRPATRR